MTNDPVLHLLGLAKKAGRLEIGEEPVGAVCRSARSALVRSCRAAGPYLSGSRTASFSPTAAAKPASVSASIAPDRVLQRQKEQRQHEKKLRQGRQKPWAPLPAKEERPPSQRGSIGSGYP